MRADSLKYCLAVCAIAVAPPARAQCYVFTGGGVRLQVNIATVNMIIGPTTLMGYRTSTFTFSGTNSLTQGGVVKNSTSFLDGTMNIQYFPSVGASTAVTTFQVVVPSTNPDTPPTRGEHSWELLLVGAGDIIPSGLIPAVVPPIGVWTTPPTSTTPANGTSENYIQIAEGSTRTKYPVDGVGTCNGAGSLDLAKTFGIACDFPGCASCGEPINLGTGNVFETVTDYETAGTNKLSFGRYYNSMAGSTTYAVRLGVNWRSTYDRYLRLAASSVIAERHDGAQVTFALANGAWSADSDRDYKLTNSGSTWTLTAPDDSVETYSALNSNEALLQSIRARNGYTQTLQYDSGNALAAVTDSYNRGLSFTYNTGRLATVTTPDSLVLTYGYTGNKLTSVAYSTAPATSQTYLYENTALPSALTGIVDENGNRFVTWTYDSTGRGLSSQFAGGADLTRITYNDTDGSRTVTNALGAQTVYKFTPLQGSPKVTEIDRPATAAAPANITKFTYDANGYPASRTDGNGIVTSYVNDTHGRPTTVFEASGTPQARTTTYTYHPTFHLPAKIVEPGLTTTFTYDTAGNLLTRTLADTTTATVPYSTNGQTRTWTYTWSNFLPATVQKPRTDVAALTQYTYDSTGALTGVTNALGQTTQITQHLPGGLPQTIVDPNGVTTQLTYDARLRLLANTVNTAAGALTVAYSYDAAGNRTGVTYPDGSSVTSTFDAAHRLTGVTDLFNQSTSMVLDALGDSTKTSLLDSTGKPQRTRSRSYDSLGRLLQDVSGAGQTIAYTYDANGNPLTVTDPLKRVTQKSFDALNRPVKVTDPAKGVTTTVWDAHDRPTSVTDPNGGVTSYVYDGFGDVIQRVSPDSGTTVYRYDGDGNLTQTVDASGAVSNHSYDALDRILATTYPADPAENIAFAYDQPAAGFGIGRLTGVTDAAGSLRRTYDERGNVLTETRVNGSATLTTAYTYDAAGRRSSVAYPSGWTVTYTRDIMGRATAIAAQPPDGSPAVPVLAGVGYQAFGPVNSMTFGNGVAEARSFDPDYRVAALADAGAAQLQALTYSYDAADNVTKIADGVAAANSQSFVYDALNRLTAATGAYGSLSYTYDSVGNRLTQGQGGSAANYVIAPRSNQLASVSAAGVSQPVAYTKTGNIGSFNPAGGAPVNFTYNQAGRLAAVTSGGNPAARYTYDAFGQRLAKVAASTTLYQYDASGHLLEETDDAGDPLVDYVYLDSLPVAAISPAAGQVYFLHDDRLGTPQTATDSSQSVVWTSGYSPFGELTSVPSLIVQNLRLPGQEYDADTGLYHNGFRDYAPVWGRYIQSDPIGLAGGLNTYAYAGANPVKLIDPSGMLSLKDISDTFDQLGNKISDEWQVATAQLQTLRVLGPSQYLAYEYPEVHTCLVEVEAKAKELWDESAPIREIYDLYSKLADFADDAFMGTIGLVPDLFKYGSQQKDWGAKCGSCNPIPTLPLQTQPPPTPTPAQ